MSDLRPIRNNFNAGELSEKLDFRGDVTKYHSGCVTLQNMIPLVEGGIVRCPGTYYVEEVKTSSKKVRLVKFHYKDEHSYILEFGDLYIRFYKDSQQVAATEVVTTYTEAQLPELKFNQSVDTFYISHPSHTERKLIRTSDTIWTLKDIDFKPSATREFGHEPATTLTPGATTGSTVTFTAGAAAFISGDVGRVISYGDARATITIYNSSTIIKADIISDFQDTNPIASGDWKIEGTPTGFIIPSRVDKGALCTLTGKSNSGVSDIIRLNIPGVPYSTYNGVLTWYWKESSTTPNEYYFVSLTNTHAGVNLRVSPIYIYVNGVSYTKDVAGSLLEGEWAFGDNDSIGYNTVYIRLPGNANPQHVASLQRYDGLSVEIFRTEDVGKFVKINSGVVQITEYKTAFVVVGDVLSNLESVDPGPWTLEEPFWNDTLGYPSFSYFFEQRLILTSGNTLNFSVIADYENFTVDPITDDATIEYSLVANEPENINWLAGSDYLMVGTFSSIWKVSATDTREPLTQTNVSAKKLSTVGTKNIEPINVTDSVVFVDKSGRKINRLDYKFDTDNFVLNNLTRLASHITFGETEAETGIVELAFQQSPIPIIWAIRADGQLIGMTYETQEEIYAWFRVVTDGYFESIAILDENDGEDQVWVSVKRTINGQTVRYVEYFSPHELFGQIEDSFFVHSGVTFDGGDAITITGITNANPAVVSAVNTFSGGEKINISDVLGMDEANTDRSKAWTVANQTGTTFELSGIDSTSWGTYTSGGTAQVVQKDFSTGLDHLEGETLDIVADGAVHSQETVTTGAVSLDYYGNKVHMGLPITPIVEPTKPYLDTGDGGSTRGKQQRIYGALLSFYDTFGCKVGRNLTKTRKVKFGTGAAPQLFTGEKEISFDGYWEKGASFVITQDLPLPLNIRAITYKMDVEG